MKWGRPRANSDKSTRRFSVLSLAAAIFILCMDVVLSAPDLIVEDIWSSPSVMVQGEAFTFYARIRNVGTSSTPLLAPLYVNFLRNDGFVSVASHGMLSAGQDVTVAINAVAPASGYHQFTAITDAENRVAESDEANNRRDEVWQVLPPPFPDLVVVGITKDPENPPEGSPFTANITVRNSGTASAGASAVGFYLDGVFKGTIPVNPLSAGQQQTVSGSFTVPTALPSMMSAKADNNNQLTESNESNNWYERVWTLMPIPLPDLVIVGIGTTPSQPISGQSYTLSITVRNIGGSGAGSSTIGLRLGGSLVDTIPVGPISAGGQVVVQKTGTAPQAGHYTLCAIADLYNQVEESNEGNNTHCTTLIVQPPPLPDLVITELYTVPANPVSGEAFTLYARVLNQGAASLRLFAGFDTAFFVDGVNMGSGRYFSLFMPLDPVLSVLVSRSATAPAAGSHTISAQTDFLNEMQEQSEGNNTRTGSMTVLPPPVLQVSAAAMAFGYTPTQQTFNVWNSSNGTLTYSNSADRMWLSVTPATGSSTGQVNQIAVSVDVSGLLIGSHTGTLAVSSRVGVSNVTVTVIIADDNADGIPDGWEIERFESVEACDPDGDWDEDELSNCKEWIAGTDPKDKSSRFVFNGVGMVAEGDGSRIEWPTLPGRLYTLHHAPTLAAAFVPIAVDLPHTQNYYEEVPLDATGFYRVTVRLETE